MCARSEIRSNGRTNLSDPRTRERIPIRRPEPAAGGKWVVPDTSALMKRPRLIGDLSARFDRVIVPEVVVAELNHQKDRKRNNSAWLAMSGITNLKKQPGSNIEYSGCGEPGRINDDTIINTAAEAARRNPGVTVYVVSNDVYFQMRRDIPGVVILNMEEYDRTFGGRSEGFSAKDSAEFFAAVRSGNVDRARKVFEKGNCDPNREDPDEGFTPLIAAVRGGNPEMVRLLAGIPSLDLDRRDQKKYALPPIAHAVQKRNLEAIRILIGAGCDVDAQGEGKNTGNTALMIACWHGLDEFVDELIGAGACINQQDSNGYTPLMKCCIRDHPSCARRILDTGRADLGIRSRIKGHRSALDFAEESGDEALIDMVSEASDD